MNENTEKNLPTLLANWYDMPSRPELLQPFVEMSEYFNIVLLYYFYKEESQENNDKLRRIYWYDYASPQQILEEIKPDAVLFAGLQTLYTIALNFCSKKGGIPTFELQHGIINKVAIDKLVKQKSNLQFGKIKHYLYIISFYLNGVGLSIKFWRFLIETIFKGELVALRNNQFYERMPVKYLCFTKNNTAYYELRDGEIADRIIEIGNPLLDNLFKYLVDQNKASIENYVLLIDTCSHENQELIDERKITFYEELNKFAMAKEYRLIVKLHPHAYKVTNRPDLANIKYITDIPLKNLAELINGAKLIFSFFSSLLMPMVAVSKKLITIRLKDEIPDEWEKYGIISSNMNYKEFLSSRIRTEGLPRNKEYFEKFVKDFCFRVDGQSSKRLINAILNEVREKNSDFNN